MLIDLTEEKWLAHIDADRLIRHLQRRHRIGKIKAGQRKLRLYACGVCRTFLSEIRVPAVFPTLVDAAERHAEGHIKKATMTAKDRGTFRQVPKPYSSAAGNAAEAMRCTILDAEVSAAGNTASYAADALKKLKDRFGKRKTADLVRDVFGNPFRTPVIDVEVLQWRDGTVVKMAQAIYDERRFGDLPVLADALEEAGSSDRELLDHCRSAGPHVRGCWVIDLLLGMDYQR